LEKSQALMLLQRALGDSKANLRPGQWEAIDALVNHRRKLLVVERTGWGKSLIYFISTRVLRDRRGIGNAVRLLIYQAESSGLCDSPTTVNRVTYRRDRYPQLLG
jgi:superfamily II DNA helicase RecQ